jgi:deoxycytidylate deaminase
VVKVSSRPIVYGSELDDLPVASRPDCLQHKPRVVFLVGAVQVYDRYVVAVGVNDSACALLNLTREQLYL